MISEKINRDNKREEKNMGKRKIIQITVLTTLVLTLSFASASTMAPSAVTFFPAILFGITIRF